MLEHLTEMFDVSGPIYVNFVATKSFHFPALSKRVHSFDLVFLIVAPCRDECSNAARIGAAQLITGIAPCEVEWLIL